MAAWAALAGEAVALLGGPLPPGDLPPVVIPDAAWDLITARPPFTDGIAKALWPHVTPGSMYCDRDATLSDRLWHSLVHATGVRWPGRAAADRALSLIPWFLTAVRPWWHLAVLAGIPTGDAEFTAWIAEDAEAQDALEILGGMGSGTLKTLAGHPDKWDNRGFDGPGHTLAALTAAYSGVPVPSPAHDDIAQVLKRLARARTITAPAAVLLTRLRPDALNEVLGPDLTSMADRDLSLPPGTSGRVIRQILRHMGPASDDTLQRLADRSLHELPVTPLPDYGDYLGGPHVIDARVTSASLIRAGLAAPGDTTVADYLAEVRAIWTPHARHES
jgi:hypothetical protein